MISSESLKKVSREAIKQSKTRKSPLKLLDIQEDDDGNETDNFIQKSDFSEIYQYDDDYQNSEMKTLKSLAFISNS